MTALIIENISHHPKISLKKVTVAPIPINATIKYRMIAIPINPPPRILEKMPDRFLKKDGASDLFLVSLYTGVLSMTLFCVSEIAALSMILFCFSEKFKLFSDISSLFKSSTLNSSEPQFGQISIVTMTDVPH